jgi:uncharacterized membrane protein
MLVHFPIVFWSCALAADVAGVVAQAPLAATVASATLALGCATGLLAMIAGILDFVGVAKDSPAREPAVAHLMAMCGAWLIFLMALALHGYPPVPVVSVVALLTTVVGFVTMAIGGWLGGKLVYQFKIGSV